MMSFTYAVDFINQIPGFIMCIDMQDKITFCNDAAVKLLGFESLDEIVDVHISNIRCKAAEYAHVFNQQNNLVTENGSLLKIIDIHPYRNNQVTTLLTHKSPFYDTKNSIAGTLIHSTELTHHHLQNISYALKNSDKKYRLKSNNQRSYHILNDFDLNELTHREMECLFYYIRGKTAGQISNLLFISKRTVEKHLENLKCKLDCDTKSQLIEKAIENNFLDYIPKSIFQESDINLSLIIS